MPSRRNSRAKRPPLMWLPLCTRPLPTSSLRVRPIRATQGGARAPKFALPNAHGQLVRSSDLLAKGPLVLTFYRGIWCPYCNMDLQAIEAAADEIRALGASLVAISPQTAPNRRKSERENGLTFPILSDHGNSIANEFGFASACRTI